MRMSHESYENGENFIKASSSSSSQALSEFFRVVTSEKLGFFLVFIFFLIY